MQSEKFYSLIRYSICNEPLPAGFSCGKNEIETFLKIAKIHDVSAIVVSALEENGMLADNENKEAILDEMLFSVGRVSALDYFLEEVLAVLEEAGFDHVVLKGSEIRKLYPRDFFRTSSDIDILVRKEDFIGCEKLLAKKLSLKEKQRTMHDVALSRSDLETVELHFSLIEEGEAMGADEIISAVWDYAEKGEGHRYYLSNEFFVFYLVAHVMKHFLFGGCGLRFFIDLFVCEKLSVDSGRLDEMMEKGGLSVFYGYCKNLVDLIFRGKKADDTTAEMEEFVMRSGVYGTMETHVALASAKKGKGLKYILKRIFLSYDELSLIFPKLKNRRWLTPWYQIIRWLKMLFGGKMARNLKEAEALKNADEKHAEKIEALFKDIGVIKNEE